MIAIKFRKNHSVHVARTFVRSLKLRNQDGWQKFYTGTMQLTGFGNSPLPHEKVQNKRKARKLGEGPIVDGLKMMTHPGRLGAFGEGQKSSGKYFKNISDAPVDVLPVLLGLLAK